MRRVNVIGVGMTKFTTPKAKIPFTTMGKEAVEFPEGQCFNN